MTVGNTTTDAMADSMPTVVASARQVREFDGVVPQLCDKVTLGEGTGLSWHEVTLAQLTAQNVTETTELDNPQQMSDALFSITPTVSGIHTFVSDRVARRISKNAFAKTGGLAQNAIQRKKDEDGITVFDGFTSLCGAGTTLASGYINAAVRRITSNATEQGRPPYRFVGHGFQIKDLEDELRAGVGTYPLVDGKTSKVYENFYRGKVGGAEIFEDGNITIDSSDDAKGAVFAKEAIVLVQGHRLKTETRREPQRGGGGTSMWLYDEYAYGERLAAGTTSGWGFEIYSDATTPTS